MTVRTPSKAALLKPEDLPPHERGGGASATADATPTLTATGATNFVSAEHGKKA